MRRFKQTPDIRAGVPGQGDVRDQDERRIKWYSMINKELASRVKSYARGRGCSRSVIVTMALEEFLDRHPV